MLYFWSHKINKNLKEQFFILFYNDDRWNAARSCQFALLYRVTWLAIVGYLILKIRLTHEIFSKVFVCFTAEIYSKVFICHCWVAVKFLFVSKLWPARLYSVSQFTDWSLHHELVRRPILRRLYYLKKQGCIFFKLDSTRTIFRGTPKSRYTPGSRKIVNVISKQYKINSKQILLIKGGSKKTSLNLRNSFCLISPATKMIDGWNIIHLKSEIHSSVWSTKTFLYDIRELSYMQNNIGYQISRIW